MSYLDNPQERHNENWRHVWHVYEQAIVKLVSYFHTIIHLDRNRIARIDITSQLILWKNLHHMFDNL